ncbi:MAG: hypothetical protein ACKPKO_56990, partial [Candidatus Fonsibacter sp.]
MLLCHILQLDPNHQPSGLSVALDADELMTGNGSTGSLDLATFLYMVLFLFQPCRVPSTHLVQPRTA